MSDFSQCINALCRNAHNNASEWQTCSMETVAERITKAMKARRTNPTALSNAMIEEERIPQTTIHRMANGVIKDPKADKLNLLAAALDIDTLWLQTGRGCMYTERTNSGPSYANPRGATVVTLPYKYPLISSVQAGAWTEIRDAFLPTEAEKWITSEKRASKLAFWLEVRGESMEPDYPAGGVILVDPEVSATAGSYVVAKLTNVQEATFKKLVTDNGKWYLLPLNRLFDKIEIDSPDVLIVGKVLLYQPASKPMP